MTSERKPLSDNLLPSGFHDRLPPIAELEASVTERLMSTFASHGYSRIKPSMFEFAETVSIGSGPSALNQAFQGMDPASQRMIGLRIDTTPQIARIVSGRLRTETRPLRLSYACPCVHIHGHQVTQNREFDQVGIELIGPNTPEADAEIFVTAIEGLFQVGLRDLSVDLTIPSMTTLLMDYAGIAGSTRQLLTDALDRKDIAAVYRHGGSISHVLSDLLKAVGNLDRALEVMETLPLPPPSKELAYRLRQVITLIRAAVPALRVTVDLVEFRGFQYEEGISGSIHGLGHPVILGRAGRYRCPDAESGVGATLYPDSILGALVRPKERDVVYVAADATRQEIRRLRALGYVVVPEYK